nr:VOC family protein [Allonocardiopsis opalescens]
MHHTSVVVEDLAAAVAYFVELGMELEGETTVEGPSVDGLCALRDVRADIAMVRTPDGRNRLELTKYHRPEAVGATDAPVNTLGLRSIMFTVTDLDDTIARLRPHGGELVGKLERYENAYRLCYLRGPAGIIVALAERIG